MKRKFPFTGIIILAGGKGKRMGKEKQFIPVGGKPALFWSVEAFAPFAGEMVIVLDRAKRRKLSCRIKELGLEGKVKFASPGRTRMYSLRNARGLLSGKVRLVAVHDGARPLVSRAIIGKCLSAALKWGAAVPAVPLKDTVKKVKGGFIEETPDRKGMVAVQTPQCYRRAVFDKIFSRDFRGDCSDESQILEKNGVRVKTAESDYSNIKITTPEDIVMAEALMGKKKAAGKVKKIRFGFGYDIHRLVEGRPFIIAGEKIKHKKGMLGHSDGDVLIHAVCDAILGSVAAGEIGVYFPPTDLTIMGISSRVIAEKVLEILGKKKAKIIQIDATLVAEAPKLKPYYEKMRRNIAEIFRMDLNDVSIKAKSREGLGEIGHGEAISCYAVASVEA